MKDMDRYIAQAEVTERKFPDGLVLNTEQAELLHAAMGLVTESGELMDALKKNIIYGKDIDVANVNEELGDLYWYIAIVHRYLIDKGILPTDTLNTNIEKLRKRYPEGFTSFDALNRDLVSERNILDNAI